MERKGLDRLVAKVRRNRFIATYTSGLTSEDLQRLFTRDTVEAYRFFTRGIDPGEIAKLPWHRRIVARVRVFFLAFTLKLSPARRIVRSRLGRRERFRCCAISRRDQLRL